MSIPITVLMSVYNGEAHLAEAIDSILGQVCQDFELLVFEDGSRDRSQDMLQSYRHPRLRVVSNETNIGLSATLNRGLSQIESKYIARMDADDIADPHRLQRQFEFMESHPEVGICGTWVRYFGREKRTWRPPVSDTGIRAKMLFDSPFAHPSVMIRRSVLVDNHLTYSERSRYCQDYRLWTDCAPFCQFHNIPDILLRYRVHARQSGVTAKQEQQAVADRVRVSFLEKTLGLNLSPSETETYLTFIRAERGISGEVLVEIDTLLQKILNANASCSAFAGDCLARELSRRWARVCRRSVAAGKELWSIFRSSTLSGHVGSWAPIQVGFRCLKNK